MLHLSSGIAWVGNAVFGEDNDDEGFAPSDTVSVAQTVAWGPLENRGSPSATPFPFDPTLSVRVYVGNVLSTATLSVAAEACVVFESPSIDSDWDDAVADSGAAESIGHRLRKMGGGKYRREVAHIMQVPLRSGEARSSKAPPHMPMDRIMHTVGPKYKDKYATSAQNTLGACLRECFELAIEHKCRSISLPMIYRSKNFPVNTGAHTILRTTRRWMERLDLDTVVFIGTHDDMKLYNELLPVYFPRSHEEACAMLPAIMQLDVGNSFGELTVVDRKIRISAPLNSEHDEGTLDVSFLHESTSPNFDAVCKKRLETTAWECKSAEEVSRVYQRYLREARKYNFEHLIDRGFLQFEEVRGRKVVALLGSLFPAHVDPKILVLFIVSYLDPKIKDRYSLLYVHTNVKFAANAPSWTLFCELMRIFTTRFTPTLDTVVILHPDIVFKAMFSVAALCIAHTLWPGVSYADRLYDLEQLLGPVTLPEYVLAHDRSIP